MIIGTKRATFSYEPLNRKAKTLMFDLVLVNTLVTFLALTAARVSARSGADIPELDWALLAVLALSIFVSVYYALQRRSLNRLILTSELQVAFLYTTMAVCAVYLVLQNSDAHAFVYSIVGKGWFMALLVVTFLVGLIRGLWWGHRRWQGLREMPLMGTVISERLAFEYYFSPPNGRTWAAYRGLMALIGGAIVVLNLFFHGGALVVGLFWLAVFLPGPMFGSVGFRRYFFRIQCGGRQITIVRDGAPAFSLTFDSSDR